MTEINFLRILVRLQKTAKSQKWGKKENLWIKKYNYTVRGNKRDSMVRTLKKNDLKSWTLLTKRKRKGWLKKAWMEETNGIIIARRLKVGAWEDRIQWRKKMYS